MGSVERGFAMDEETDRASSSRGGGHRSWRSRRQISRFTFVMVMAGAGVAWADGGAWLTMHAHGSGGCLWSLTRLGRVFTCGGTLGHGARRALDEVGSSSQLESTLFVGARVCGHGAWTVALCSRRWT